MTAATLTADNVWGYLQERMQNELPTLSYNTWFRDTRAVVLLENRLILTTPHTYVRDAILNKFMTMLSAALDDFGASDLRLEFIDEADKSKYLAQSRPSGQDQCGLCKDYTFEHFIVGNCNRMASAAATAVSVTPADVYNPLLFYGSTGLGKTHLLHAIGNSILENNPSLRVLYVTSETFSNDLIASIRANRDSRDDTRTDFRRKYRGVDVLLIDDIQFIAGQNAAQVEFFHTFNELRDQNKQIVLTSDRPPREIQHLEERLRSRFEYGLLVDIQPPDLETSIAILLEKAKNENINPPRECLEYIAENSENNVRALEGRLTRVIAHARLSGKGVDLQTAKEALKDVLPMRPHVQITPNSILELISGHYAVTMEQLVSPTRAARVAMARQVAMYLIRECTPLSLPRIGEVLGGRDHSTIIHGIEKIEEGISNDTTLRQEVLGLKRKLLDQ